MKRYKIVKSVLADSLASAIRRERDVEPDEAFESDNQEDVEEDFKVKGF